MAKLTQHKTTRAVKMILMGKSGSGKTGALASLVQAGYELAILDFDNGLDFFASLLSKEESDRVFYVSLRDQMKAVAGKAVVKQVTAAKEMAKYLDNWKDDDLGPVSSWPLSRILVIDSITNMAKALFNHVLSVNGRLNQTPYKSDWGNAMFLVDNYIQLLTAPETPCHVIFMAHVEYLEDEYLGIVEGLPVTLGKKLSPKIGTYFNSTLYVTRKGTGTNTKREIQTIGADKVECKVATKGVPATLPHATGLAEYFKLVTGDKCPTQ